MFLCIVLTDLCSAASISFEWVTVLLFYQPYTWKNVSPHSTQDQKTWGNSSVGVFGSMKKKVKKSKQKPSFRSVCFLAAAVSAAPFSHYFLYNMHLMPTPTPPTRSTFTPLKCTTISWAARDPNGEKTPLCSVNKLPVIRFVGKHLWCVSSWLLSQRAIWLIPTSCQWVNAVLVQFYFTLYSACKRHCSVAAKCRGVWVVLPLAEQ